MRSEMTTHKIEDLLKEGHRRFTPLQRLLKTSTNQKLWTQQLRALLDAPLRNQVEIAEVRGPTAVILCHSAAAATRLRFILPELGSALRELQSFSQVQEFKIQVSNSAT